MELLIILKILIIVRIIILFILLLYFGIYKVFEKEIYKLSYPDSLHISIIEENKSLKYSSEAIKEHNEMLVNTLINFKNDHQTDHSVIEGRMNQTNIIYFMVLTAVLVYLINKSNEITELNDLIPFFFILGVIILMYALNIHFEDSKRNFFLNAGWRKMQLLK